MEPFNLFLGLEYLVNQSLNHHEQEGRDEKDVGEEKGKFSHFVSAECLDIPHVVARILRCYWKLSTLVWFRAKVAEEWSAGKKVSGNIDCRITTKCLWPAVGLSWLHFFYLFLVLL